MHLLVGQKSANMYGIVPWGIPAAHISSNLHESLSIVWRVKDKIQDGLGLIQYCAPEMLGPRSFAIVC